MGQEIEDCTKPHMGANGVRAWRLIITDGSPTPTDRNLLYTRTMPRNATLPEAARDPNDPQ